MTDPVEKVRAAAQVKYRRNWVTWAQRDLTAFPVAFRLHGAGMADSAADLQAAQTVALRWLAYAGPGTVEKTPRRWPGMRVQQVPSRLVLQTPAEVAEFAGQSDHWARATERLRALHDAFPRLQVIQANLLGQVVDFAAEDWGFLFGALQWAETADVDGLLPRQLAVHGGADTKWVERHWSLVEAFAALGVRADGDPLAELRKIEKPTTVAILDPKLRTVVGGLRVFAAAPIELASLDLRPATVILCENLQNVHAFTDIPGSVVLAGKGYDVVAQSRIPWVRAARVLYWGDVDTHGFAILHELRESLPGTPSVLMDEATLLAGRATWVKETLQTDRVLDQLDGPEQDLYQALLGGDYGHNVRLEQERVPWPTVVEALRAAGVPI